MSLQPVESPRRERVTAFQPVVDHQAPAAAVPAAFEWDLRQNCALRPRQLLGAHALLCLVVASVGVGAAIMDAPVIAAFAALDILMVSVAGVHYVRHVRDGEIVTLVGRQLLVEAYRARDVRRRVFDCAWLRVTHDGNARSPLWLDCGTARWPLGLHVTHRRRLAAQRQLNEAIAAARRCGDEIAALH